MLLWRIAHLPSLCCGQVALYRGQVGKPALPVASAQSLLIIDVLRRKKVAIRSSKFVTQEILLRYPQQFHPAYHLRQGNVHELAAALPEDGFL